MSKTTSIIPNSVDDPNKQFTPKAYISIKSDGKRCLIKFKGNTVELADMIFTALSQNDLIAAVTCQTAKDFIEKTKANREAWQTLTQNCAEVNTKLANRYHRKPAANPIEVSKKATEEQQEGGSDEAK